MQLTIVSKPYGTSRTSQPPPMLMKAAASPPLTTRVSAAGFEVPAPPARRSGCAGSGLAAALLAAADDESGQTQTSPAASAVGKLVAQDRRLLQAAASLRASMACSRVRAGSPGRPLLLKYTGEAGSDLEEVC